MFDFPKKKHRPLHGAMFDNNSRATEKKPLERVVITNNIRGNKINSIKIFSGLLNPQIRMLQVIYICNLTTNDVFRLLLMLTMKSEKLRAISMTFK